jgi:hypothetical protein
MDQVQPARVMSAFSLEADIPPCPDDVGLGPKAALEFSSKFPSPSNVAHVSDAQRFEPYCFGRIARFPWALLIFPARSFLNNSGPPGAGLPKT